MRAECFAFASPAFQRDFFVQDLTGLVPVLYQNDLSGAIHHNPCAKPYDAPYRSCRNQIIFNQVDISANTAGSIVSVSCAYSVVVQVLQCCNK